MNIRNIIPTRVYVQLQSLKAKYNIRHYFGLLGREESKYFALPDNLGQRQLETRMLFFAHQLEKGLSHSDFREKFGKRPLYMLNQLLQAYFNQGYEKSTFEISIVFSVLKAYKNKHDISGHELPAYYMAIYNTYSKEIDEADPKIAGSKLTNTIHYENTYSNVIQNRISVREFKEGNVDIDKINRALSLAMRAPSVCNRQSQQVRVITDNRLINDALRIQGGWKGYKNPPALLLVTSHLSSFLDPVERNEPYVDGGIFSMALLGALEEERLGACPLNTMFSKEQDRKIRNLLHVPNEEVMIMFIAVGNKPENVLHPLSKRRDVDSVVTYLE